MDISTRNSPPVGKRVVGALRYYLSGRRGLLLSALLIVSTGTYLGWGWLVAAGIAPVLLALAPCAAMCALGLCMSKSSGNSCSDAAGEGSNIRQPQTAANASQAPK